MSWKKRKAVRDKDVAATAKGHTINATTRVHQYVQEGASVLKSLQLLIGSPLYNNIQDAFQATKGNSEKALCTFFFSAVTICWERKVIKQINRAFQRYSFSYKVHRLATTLSPQVDDVNKVSDLVKRLNFGGETYYDVTSMLHASHLRNCSVWN